MNTLIPFSDFPRTESYEDYLNAMRLYALEADRMQHFPEIEAGKLQWFCADDDSFPTAISYHIWWIYLILGSFLLVLKIQGRMVLNHSWLYKFFNRRYIWVHGSIGNRGDGEGKIHTWTTL
jgi:hypothetical protein